MSMTVNIVKTPDVLHGKPRIEGTRIGVFMLGESIREGGQSIEEILEGYPDLSHEQVKAALDYYDHHQEEMDALRAEEEEIIERLRERSRAASTDGGWEPDADA
jgi:uncharacterized protein (DUF433 family)